MFEVELSNNREGEGWQIMSKRMLDELEEARHAGDVARALGITADELNQTVWSVEEHTGSDGALHGYNIYFDKGSSPEVLNKIASLGPDGEWVRIGPVLRHRPDSED